MTLIADGSGNIKGQFTVPPQVPTGTKLVQFIGNQGNYGEATYTARGIITTEERRRVTTITDVRRDETTVVLTRFDPLAQTFTLSQSRHIGGIDLWFTVSGLSRVVIQIRDTMLGVPTQNVLAEQSILPTAIFTNGTATRITWNPMWCEAGQEYAVVLLTDDGEASVKIAELSKYDAVHDRWVTSQPYQVGVLLSSSNASTWTPHQNLDLTFRLLAATFIEERTTLELGKTSIKQVSDIMALASVERVTSSTDVEFSLTTKQGKELRLSEDMPVQLQENLDGTITMRAHLKGSAFHSPVLYPGIQLILGTQKENAEYITRAIAGGSQAKVSITYEAELKGTAEVKAYMQLSSGEWHLVTLTERRHIGENRIERTHKAPEMDLPETRVKLVLSGNLHYRPKVRSLRVVIT